MRCEVNVTLLQQVLACVEGGCCRCCQPRVQQPPHRSRAAELPLYPHSSRSVSSARNTTDRASHQHYSSFSLSPCSPSRGLASSSPALRASQARHDLGHLQPLAGFHRRRRRRPALPRRRSLHLLLHLPAAASSASSPSASSSLRSAAVLWWLWRVVPFQRGLAGFGHGLPQQHAEAQHLTRTSSSSTSSSLYTSAVSSAVMSSTAQQRRARAAAQQRSSSTHPCQHSPRHTTPSHARTRGCNRGQRSRVKDAWQDGVHCGCDGVLDARPEVVGGGL